MHITMNKLTYILLALSFLLASCTEEDTLTASPTVQMVKAVIPLSFQTPEPATDDSGNEIRSVVATPETTNDFRLYATGSKSSIPTTRAITAFNHVWVLAFAQDGTCLSSSDAGTASPETPITASLPKSNNITLYILANGPATLTKPATLTDFEGATYYSTEIYANESEVPYVGKISGVNVDENGRLSNDTGTDVNVPLKRIAAKLSLTCTLPSSDYTIASVQLFNAPSKMYYIYSNTAADVDADGLDAPSVAENTYTWFLGENLRGTGSSNNQTERFAAKAPDSSTYIRVTLQSTLSAEKVTYDIYPGKNLTNNYDLSRNWDYIYTTTFSKNGSELSSDKRVTITDIPIDLTKIPSNCYIMEPGKSYKFDPRIKGEGQEETGGISIPVNHNAEKMQLLWQDTKSLVKSIGISSDHSIAVVNLTPDLEGNAVVSAYAGGKVVWSWHLWVRSKGLDVYTTNNVSGMSCVLGANNRDNNDFNISNSRGLFYQWGRNIPFPISSSVEPNTPIPVYDIYNNPVNFDISNGPQSISWVIEHPMTFYYTNVSGSSWHSDGDDLWGGTSGKKTIFDPCPRDWKIPQNNSIWNNWTSDLSANERFIWDSTKLARMAHEQGIPRGLYPAAGFYVNIPVDSKPVLQNVGYEGRYWTALYTEATAGILRFTASESGSTNPNNNMVDRIYVDQTYGCSVRPVKY